MTFTRHDSHAPDGHIRRDGHGAGSGGWRWPAPVYSPRVGQVLMQLLTRAVLPGLVVWLVIVAIGKLIMGPLGELEVEDSWSQRAAATRTPLLDSLTHLWSSSTDTWMTIGSGIVLSLLVWFLTRRWWVGMVPLLAISLESSIFVTATHLVGRPRPEVQMLDVAPPTSSFPSGHAAAAMALWLSIAILAQRIDRPWLRRPITVVAVLLPILVTLSRFYRGAHHVSDLVVGVLLGIFCAVVANRAVHATRVAPHEELLDRAR